MTERHTLPVLGTVVICTLPHFVNVSPWVVIACLLLWAYTFAGRRYAWPVPGWITLQVVAGIFFITTILTHDGFTLEAFVALLILMIGLKLLEMRTKRDRIITVILCYFLIVAVMFFSDSLVATTYMLFSVLYATAVLIHINRPGQGAMKPLKLSTILIIQALPVMLVLFLLFPRFHGSLWGRAPITSIRTGFTDKMTFGDVADLARNTGVAFRVKFDGEIPPHDQLYWRGIVLWKFDGRTWQRGIGRHGIPSRRPTVLSRTSYTITLEPHNERWLLVLDLPLRVNLRRAWLLNDYTFYRWRPITQRIAYHAESDIDAHAPLQEGFKRDALKLPININPRTRSMAAAWANESANTQEYIQRVLAYFQEQPFSYTLNPPSLEAETEKGHAEEKDLIDRFMFESRMGFCEHYAGTFAFLMRAAGVPARVVVGYLGGTLNRYGDYLVVRQSEAHAWCEVWLPEKGWVRVDPTAAVAPDRVSRDVASALPAGEMYEFLSFLRKGRTGEWFEAVTNVWDVVNNRWNNLVMGYSAYEQKNLFAGLGLRMDDWKGPVKVLVIVLMVGLVTILFSMLILHKQNSAMDEIADSWKEFCRKLAKIDLPRRPQQGPVDYMEHVVTKRPDLKESVQEVVSLYVRLRYKNDAGPDAAMSFKTIIKRFQPKKIHGTE